MAQNFWDEGVRGRVLSVQRRGKHEEVCRIKLSEKNRSIKTLMVHSNYRYRSTEALKLKSQKVFAKKWYNLFKEGQV